MVDEYLIVETFTPMMPNSKNKQKKHANLISKFLKIATTNKVSFLVLFLDSP